MLYVLCAEVLAIEIRTNRNIVGYVFNKGKDQHKITLFADDKAVCVTTDNSVLELFNVLDRYEAATNSSINKEKQLESGPVHLEDTTRILPGLIGKITLFCL